MSQNAPLEAQLISQQNIAQGLAELSGAITTVLKSFTSTNKKDASFFDPNGLGKPPVFSGRKEDFYVWGPRRSRTTCLVCSRTCVDLWRLQQSRKTWSEQQQLRLACLNFGVETSAEIDGQLFVVLSALTDGESFEVVVSARGDHGFESWRKPHGRWNPYTAERARSLLREILSLPRAKLLELMCAIEKMDDLVKRCSSR